MKSLPQPKTLSCQFLKLFQKLNIEGKPSVSTIIPGFIRISNVEILRGLLNAEYTHSTKVTELGLKVVSALE